MASSRERLLQRQQGQAHDNRKESVEAATTEARRGRDARRVRPPLSAGSAEQLLGLALSLIFVLATNACAYFMSRRARRPLWLLSDQQHRRGALVKHYRVRPGQFWDGNIALWLSLVPWRQRRQPVATALSPRPPGSYRAAPRSSRPEPPRAVWAVKVSQHPVSQPPGTLRNFRVENRLREPSVPCHRPLPSCRPPGFVWELH